MAVTIALTNAKGGVAKTTTSITLACSLARRGFKTLLIDTDSQASASLSLGLTKDELNPSIADVLYEECRVEQCIRLVKEVEGLSLITASMELIGFDITYANFTPAHLVLSQFLSPIRDTFDFDVIVIDTAPSYGLLPINVLCFADYFIVPVAPNYLAIEGLLNLLSAVSKTRQGAGRAATLLGILITFVTRTKDSLLNINLLRTQISQSQIFATEIPRSVKVPESTAYGIDVCAYAPRCAAAIAYEHFVDEVISRVPELKID